MDSKRQQIVDKIIARMQLIKIADGYQTDLGNEVHDFETNFDESDLLAVSVCDLIDNHELAGNQPDALRQTNKLPVQLRIFGKDVRDLRKAIADVFKAIKVDKTWNGLATWTKPVKSGIIIPEQSFEIGGAAVEIEITYLTNSFDSYE